MLVGRCFPTCCDAVRASRRRRAMQRRRLVCPPALAIPRELPKLILPLAFPQAENPLRLALQIAAKPLKSMVGAQGLEPWTR